MEPCRSDCPPPIGDSDDVLIERLTAASLLLDPMPPAVLESARRLFDADRSKSGDSCQSLDRLNGTVAL